MKIIEIENLTHRFYDGTYGLENINLSIEEGEFVVIAGKNGSGKTLLSRHLNGLLEPTTGRVKIAGIPVDKDLLRARQMVGLIFQDSDSQIVGETVAEDVAFGPTNLSLDPSEVERRVKDALSTVGLETLSHRTPQSLSAGEKRRLVIADILAMNPRILVFDEPFSNLDYPGVRQILERIVDLNKAGHTIIVITHALEKALGHANRLILMDKGKIVRDGAPEEVIKVVESFGVKSPLAYNLAPKPEIKKLTWLS